jgi:hypothetical protein
VTVLTIFPVKRAVVQQLRIGHGPRSYVYPTGHAKAGEQALTGKWLFQGFAPEKAEYPFITYQFLPGARAYPWGSVMFRTWFDVKAFSENSVEAENLDALVATALDEVELQVAGQSTLICRRIADLSTPDVDEEGKKIYMAGGTYEVWTDQPLPQTVRASFTADAVIV